MYLARAERLGKYILELSQPLQEDRQTYRKINKANWEELKNFSNQKLLHGPSNKNLTNHFTEILISIVKETIPKTSPSNTHNMPWFKDYWTAIRQRRTAQRKFNNEPSTTNFCPVGCRMIRTPLMNILYMTLNNLMVRYQ